MWDFTLAGLAFGFFLSISVGPVIFAIIKYTISRGKLAGFLFVIGVSLSDLFYISLILMTNTLTIGLSNYQKPIGIIGSSLFILFGILGLLKKQNLLAMRQNKTLSQTKSDYIKILVAGFMLNTFNPGALLMWLTVNLNVIAFSFNEKISFFVGILSCILIMDLLKVALATFVRKYLTIRNIYYLNRISSILIIVIGIVLLVKTIFFTK